jgi:pimeloyl-ACP methyl ester carboxylesterase
MFWKWTKRIGIGLVGTLATLAVGGALYQSISTKIDAKKYPPIGQLVDVGGYNMHLYDTGTGGPTVVLDIGLGGPALGWSLVQPEVAKFTRVVSFDRPGNGWSDASPLERTSQNIVTELHTALHKANIPGPYILVGHSFGGLNARLFASLYPDEVAGVVLVDSSHEDQMEKILVPQPNHTVAMLAARLGVARLFNHLPAARAKIAVLPELVQNQLLAQLCTTKFMRADLQELSHFQTSCDQLKAAGGHLDDKPLIVITAGKTMSAKGNPWTQELIDSWRIPWEEFQKDLATKSTRGKRVIAEESDHHVPLHQPKIIVDSVKEIVDLLRTGS